MLRVVASLAVSAVAGVAQTTSSAPAVSEPMASQSALRLGPNDVVGVYVYGAPEVSRSVRVTPDGKVYLPLLKEPVKAQGLYPNELERAIADALKREDMLIEPLVSVTVTEYLSRTISVTGAVNRPTVFQAATPLTLLEAITRAGGLRPDAGAEVLVTIADPSSRDPVRRVQIQRLMDRADSTVDLPLNGGEKIVVPEVEKIYVVGNVKLPGIYPMQDRDAETTVFEMVALAQGIMPFARSEAYIYRRDGSGSKTEIAVPLGKIMQRKAPDVVLKPNDILYIPENKGARLTAHVLDRMAQFGTNTLSGILVWRRVN